jgi:hypothetical protein
VASRFRAEIYDEIYFAFAFLFSDQYFFIRSAAAFRFAADMPLRFRGAGFAAFLTFAHRAL